MNKFVAFVDRKVRDSRVLVSRIGELRTKEKDNHKEVTKGRRWRRNDVLAKHNRIAKRRAKKGYK